MINKVILVGNLGKDPERKEYDGGEISNFSVATSKKIKGESKTTWHNVVAFGKTAEFCNAYLLKGSKVYVEGSVDTGTYEKDGQTKVYYKVLAHQVMALSKAEKSDKPDELPNF